VLHIDVAREPDRARRAWETHLARARWITEHGYRDLLRGGHRTEGAYRIPQARYRPLPVTSRRPSSPTRS
jgi:hypothetical protein